MIITNKIGNEGLLDREKKLFLCSKHAPYSVYENVFSWVDSLTSDDCVICFNSSELEEEVMRALLVNEVPTILVVMNLLQINIMSKLTGLLTSKGCLSWCCSVMNLVAQD
jgi:hypothetical protein